MERLGRAIGWGLGAGAASLLAVEYVPSMAVLGQWTSIEALPGGRCRWQGTAGRAEVALTFDDGPHPEGTPAILDRLDELHLRATFFPLGSCAERWPELVDEIVRRGHALGTHGYAHAHHLARTPSWVRADLHRAASAMAAVGHRPRWYRPTYGQATGATFAFARRHGWLPVLWSAWGREWTTSAPRSVARRVGRRLRPGAIVLLHDSDAFGPRGMWRTVCEALPFVAAELGRRGLRAETLDALVR